jgi:hypothetical protein
LPLNLYFSWHTTEAFTVRLYSLFSNAQTFFVEYAYETGRVEYDEQLYNKLSRGLKTVSEMMKVMGDPRTDPGFYERLFGLIRNSEKRIHLERSPLTAAQVEEMLTLGDIKTEREHFEENLKAYEKRLGFRANLERERDVSFAKQLENYYDGDASGEILVMRGDMHQRMLERSLAELNVNFKSSLSHDPLPLDTQTEILVKMQLGEVVSRKDLLTSVAEQNEFSKRRYNLKTMTIAQLMGIRNDLEKLSEVELEECFRKNLGVS